MSDPLSEEIANMFASAGIEPGQAFPVEVPTYLAPNVPTGFVEYSKPCDEFVRATVEALRERNSVLVINPEGGLEGLEEVVAGELYSAHCLLISANTEQELAKIALDEAKDRAFVDAEEKLTRAGKISKDTKLPRSTDIKATASSDPDYKAAREAVVRAEEKLQLAKAYLDAIKAKISIVPGLQGARNKGF